MFYISRGKQKFSRSEVEGGKVGRLDVGKIGRFEGGKARKNLRKVAVGSSLPSSLLIPSTIPSLYLPHKIFDKWHSATYLPQNIQPWQGRLRRFLFIFLLITTVSFMFMYS